MEEICKQVQFFVLSICKVFIHQANKALQKWYGFMAIISNKLYLSLFNFIDIHVKIVFVVIQTFIASQVHTACVPIIQSNHPLQEIINCDVHTHTWTAYFKLNWVFNVFLGLISGKFLKQHRNAIQPATFRHLCIFEGGNIFQTFSWVFQNVGNVQRFSYGTLGIKVAHQ